MQRISVDFPIKDIFSMLIAEKFTVTVNVLLDFISANFCSSFFYLLSSTRSSKIGEVAGASSSGEL